MKKIQTALSMLLQREALGSVTQLDASEHISRFYMFQDDSVAFGVRFTFPVVESNTENRQLYCLFDSEDSALAGITNTLFTPSYFLVTPLPGQVGCVIERTNQMTQTIEGQVFGTSSHDCSYGFQKNSQETLLQALAFDTACLKQSLKFEKASSTPAELKFSKSTNFEAFIQFFGAPIQRARDAFSARDTVSALRHIRSMLEVENFQSLSESSDAFMRSFFMLLETAALSVDVRDCLRILFSDSVYVSNHQFQAFSDLTTTLDG